MTRRVAFLAVASLLAGCASMSPAPPKASATLAATAGNATAGSVAELVTGKYLRSAPPTNNGYTITVTAGVATVSPAACAIT